MPHIRSNARQILQENAAQIGETNIREYALSCADADPNFFRWLFETDSEDFQIPKGGMNQWLGFIDHLPTGDQ